MKPVIAITIGDFNGIGPEVALKSAVHPAVRKICQPVLVGPLTVFEEAARAFRIRVKLEKSTLSFYKPGILPVVDVGDGIWADVKPGSVTRAAGKNAGIAIEQAVGLCMSGKTHAMVTAPASKEALHLAGFNFPGQTEMVTLFSRGLRVAMMLISGTMRVALVTVHAPVRAVSEQVTKEKVLEKLDIVHNTLKQDFRITAPRIGVLALNPHAGEHGVIGTEDDAIVTPALQEAAARSISSAGPFPADAFFGNQRHLEYDAILAMYHDQGLIPLKMTSFGHGVNYSAGLSVVRTSPDHGTAFDIAGRNKANPSSTIEAVKLAVTIAQNRKRP